MFSILGLDACNHHSLRLGTRWNGLHLHSHFQLSLVPEQYTSMSFCATCRAIPWRKILQTVPRKDFYAWHKTISRDEKTEKSHYLAWHKTVSHLTTNARICQFCTLISTNIDKTFRYHIHVKEHDARPLWLEINLNVPNYVSVWIGHQSSSLELISGQFEFNTTPGTLSESRSSCCLMPCGRQSDGATLSVSCSNQGQFPPHGACKDASMDSAMRERPSKLHSHH